MDPLSVPAVFLHGFLGSPEDWHPVQRYWVSLKPVYTWSMPTDSVTWDTVLLALLAYVEGLGGICDLVGYSMGGRIAWMFAYYYPAKVRRLCILSATPGISDLYDREKRLCQDRIWADSLTQKGMGVFLREWYQQPVFRAFAKTAVFEKMLQKRENNTEAVCAQTLVSLSPALQPDLWQWVLAASIPTLFLAGFQDFKYVEIGKRLSQNPCIHTEIIPDVGHVLPLECPADVAKKVLAFLIQS